MAEAVSVSDVALRARRAVEVSFAYRPTKMSDGVITFPLTWPWHPVDHNYDGPCYSTTRRSIDPQDASQSL